MSESGRLHILTIALDDYFHGPAFRGVIDQRLWGRLETRCEQSALSALELLARADSTATFFVNEWVAARRPDLLQAIIRAGHEIALSGDGGPGFRNIEPCEMREKIRRSKLVLEDACGHRILGYRRSDVFLRPRHLSALKILAEEGFLYDSSVSPAGWAFRKQPWRRFIHQQPVSHGAIWEYPLSSLRLGNFMLPMAGGNYFRQYPESVILWSMQRWIHSHADPLVLYFRLWDLDPTQPRIHTGSILRDLRHYRNGDQAVRMINNLLQQHRFTSIARHVGAVQQKLSKPSTVSQAASAVRVRKAEPAAPRFCTPVSVIIPCFNESASIRYLSGTLDDLRAEMEREYDLQFILVDDGSTDNTWEQFKTHFGDRADSLLIRHLRNRGVAAAVLTGLQHAREIACSMDCDCSYDPRELKPMLALLKGKIDLVTASPYHPMGHVANVPAWRVGLSRSASLLYQFVTGCQLHTFTSCLRVYRRSAALAVSIENAGFLGIAELAGKMALQGSTIAEHPATLNSRLFGQSKMKITRTVGGHLKLLLKLAMQRLKGGDAVRVGARFTPAEHIIQCRPETPSRAKS